MKTIGIIAALIGAFIVAPATAQELLGGPAPGQGETEQEWIQRECGSAVCVDEEKQRKQCGRDFQRVELGMQIARVSKCTWPARLVGASETPSGRIYMYRMSRTHITTDAKGRIIQILQ
jgi:hypothetical protein